MSEAQKLEKHHQAYRLKPIGKYPYRNIEYAIADGGPFEVIAPESKMATDMQKEMPHGYYETMWTILVDGKPWGERVMRFDRYHDHVRIGFNEDDKQKARINAAHQEAKKFIDEAKRVQLYESR